MVLAHAWSDQIIDDWVEMSLAVLSAVCFLCAGPAIFADWNENDEHKMHFPQLPNPDGWDVFAGPLVQEQSKIYWLDVTVETDPMQPGTDGPQWGWKTSLDHFD